MTKKFVSSRRIISIFLCFTVVALICFWRIYIIGNDEQRVQGVTNGYTLSLGRLRGTIFDSNMQPITNSETKILAAVSPTPRAITAISSYLSGEELDAVLDVLRAGKPAVVEVKKEIDCEGIVILKVPQYVSSNTVCEHLIGYLDNENHGVSGIEKAYDQYLYSDEKIEIIYPSDAFGNFLLGDQAEILYNENILASGVSLTIDIELQKLTQNAMQDVKFGAAVVMEVGSGKIRAMVSAPRFDLSRVADYLEDENSPLLNRALSAYNVGSVFKPCVAAALLESGKNTGYVCNCSGRTSVSGHIFKCHKSNGHGQVNLASALSGSCNVFFYKISSLLGANSIYKMARKLNFGTALDMGKISTASGSLDTLKNLENSQTSLANLSIGQGKLLLSPVSILTLYEAIAGGGVYSMPSIVEGVVKNGIIERVKTSSPTRVMSEQSAKKLKEYLCDVLISGTGVSAKPSYVTAAGKTATAETGWRKDGRLIQNSWFCGFFPVEDPKYVVAVLIEDEVKNGTSGAPIFKKIADNIALYEGL